MNEILSPVGSIEAFYAAIEGGCDAVYLAGKMFGARAFSKNFTNDELIYIINYAHLYGIKVYVTCNILIYEREVESFLQFVDFLHKNNVDALIMQDLGMIDLVHKTYPNLILHGSTQMNIHNLDGAIMAQKLGLKRIVLARETPLSVIKEIKEKTDLELEVFVHGALCASYSGMCLFARSIGPRSGNRGTCSGCCRLPYQILDQNDKVLNNNNYPISMRDLMTIDNLDKLIDLKIDSFKIEGRMKGPEYVYFATKLYRETRDNYLEKNKIMINQSDLFKLNNVFNRTWTKGFIFDSQDVSNDLSPNHIGVLIGKVISSKNNYINIELDHDVSIHDGLRIINNNFEYGFILNEFRINNNKVLDAKKNNIISLKVNKKIPINSLVYRTNSYIISEEVKKIIHDKLRRISINFKMIIQENKPLELIVSDNENEIKISGDIPEKAINREITIDDIKEKLSKINNTIYKIDNIEVILQSGLFVPISKINNLKQDILEKLNETRINLFNKEYKKSKYLINLKDFEKVSKLTILTNDRKLITNKYDYVYSDNLDKTIIKIPKIINNYNNYDLDKEYLVGEIGSLNKLNNVISDYSFNVTNSYTVAYLHSIGVKRITLSLELGDSDIKDLIDNYHIRYNKHPNLELIKRTHIEVMVLKLDLGKYGNVCYLKDRFNNKYKIVKKNDLYYIYDYKETKREKNDNYYFNLGINCLREEEYI